METLTGRVKNVSWNISYLLSSIDSGLRWFAEVGFVSRLKFPPMTKDLYGDRHIIIMINDHHFITLFTFYRISGDHSREVMFLFVRSLHLAS